MLFAAVFSLAFLLLCAVPYSSEKNALLGSLSRQVRKR